MVALNPKDDAQTILRNAMALKGWKMSRVMQKLRATYGTDAISPWTLKAIYYGWTHKPQSITLVQLRAVMPWMK